MRCFQNSVNISRSLLLVSPSDHTSSHLHETSSNIGGRTPFHAGRTPAGGRTPGGRTPGHATPGHISVRQIGRTPYGVPVAHTPAYGGGGATPFGMPIPSNTYAGYQTPSANTGYGGNPMPGVHPSRAALINQANRG